MGGGEKKAKKKCSIMLYIKNAQLTIHFFLCDGLLESSRNEYTLNFVCKM